MKTRQADMANLLSGALFIALGMVFGLQSLRLDLGGGVNLGPGSFPVFLSVLLTLLGVIIVATAFHRPGEPLGNIGWRGLFFILPSPLVFALTVRSLGFIPALFLTAMLAAFASREMTLLKALIIASGITIFSTLLFSYGLDLPYPLLAPWIVR